jgi:hypothetical protein
VRGQGDRLVVLLGGVAEPRQAASVIAELFGGSVVAGPVAADLAGAPAPRGPRSRRTGPRRGGGRPAPVLAGELLAERALGGDGHARKQLVDDVYPRCCPRRPVETTPGSTVARPSRGPGRSSCPNTVATACAGSRT